VQYGAMITQLTMKRVVVDSYLAQSKKYYYVVPSPPPIQLLHPSHESENSIVKEKESSVFIYSILFPSEKPLTDTDKIFLIN